MRKIFLAIIILPTVLYYSFAYVAGNETPGPDPNSGGNGRMASPRSFAHEDYVKKGASKYFEALSYINLAMAKFEVDKEARALLTKAVPLFNEAAYYFDIASGAVRCAVPTKVNRRFQNYRSYNNFIYSAEYKSSVMLDVCRYLRRSDFSGFHARWASILREMASVCSTVSYDVTPKKMMLVFKTVRNPFANYGTIVSHRVMNRL